MVKNPPANAGDIRDVGSIPGLGRSPGGGHGHPLKYPCLENPVDRGSWWAADDGVTRHQALLKWLGSSRRRKWWVLNLGVCVVVAQSCLTLWEPVDCSLPGFSVHGVLQGGILEWVVISSPGDLPDLGIKLRSPAFQADSLSSEPPGKASQPS